MNIDPQLLNMLPAKWLLYALLAHEAVKVLGRVYVVLAEKGGIKTIFKTIYCGSAAAKKDNETKPPVS